MSVIPEQALSRPDAATFDEVRGAEIVDVSLPRDPAPAATTRTVQAATNSALIGERVQPEYPLRVATVAGGRLATSSGAVVTPDGRLVRETLWDDDHWRREFDPPPALPEPVRLPGRHASIVSLWCHNFFHWLFEALPRLSVLDRSGVDYDGLIVPENLSSFQLQTLELIGIPPERLTPFTGEHVQAEELIWVAPLAPVGYPTPFLVQWLRRALGAPQTEPARRLYLPRTTRRIVNERQVLNMLAPRGFEVVSPEGLSLRDQIALFASAAVAVGAHGAAFANGIFSPRLTVLECYQPAHVNVSISAVMAAAGHEHWSLTCRRIPALRRRRSHNMLVDVELLSRSLDAMNVGA